MDTHEQGRRGGAVASPHATATRAGAEVLERGGNAMDAAIATNAMLGVVYPHMCGIGGDMFLLHRSAEDGEVTCLNGSGPAPALATPEAFHGLGLTGIPARGPLAATVPGTVAAWEEALWRFGSRPLAELLEPAAVAAEDGVEVTVRLAAWIERTTDELADDATLGRRFLDAQRRPLPAGATLRLPELARTLRRLMADGARDLYDGALAAEVGEAVRAGDGFLRADDLARYAPDWVAPIAVPYRGMEILTTAPNSQGITALLMLNALTVLGADELEPGTAAHVEALVTAKRMAFAARDRYVSDPLFGEAPLDHLLSLDYAREALAEPALAPGLSSGGDTIYLCTTDAAGNACSLIQSVYFGFGSCFVAGDTGILLHNRGHYFSLDERHVNCLEPGKRPLHTLMACMGLQGDELRLVFGTMGADGQAQTNVQVLERHLAGATPQEAVDAPRILHGRFFPDDDPSVLKVEESFGAETIEELGRRGHDPEVLPAHDESLGHAHAIELRADGATLAGSDPRSDGAAIVVG